MLFKECDFDILNRKIVSKLITSLKNLSKIIDYNLNTKDISKLLIEKPDPRIYARYYDSVISLYNGDLHKATSCLSSIDKIVQKNIMSKNTISLISFEKKALGSDFDRYTKFLFSDFSTTSPIAQPSDLIYQKHKQKLTNALMLISRSSPVLDSALKSILSHIYIAIGKKEKGFGGVSSFMVFGGIFINAYHYDDKYRVVEFVIHELVHSILFSINASSQLVLNIASDRYPSALRGEDRPMDGVYHALLVCATIYLFTIIWLKDENLVDNDIDRIKEIRDRNLLYFKEILPVVEKYGVLSNGAKKLLGDAKEEIFS